MICPRCFLQWGVCRRITLTPLFFFHVRLHAVLQKGHILKPLNPPGNERLKVKCNESQSFYQQAPCRGEFEITADIGLKCTSNVTWSLGVVKVLLHPMQFYVLKGFKGYMWQLNQPSITIMSMMKRLTHKNKQTRYVITMSMGFFVESNYFYICERKNTCKHV